MILVTSISPKHSNKENQHQSIKSWQHFGAKCYSLNGPSEIDGLRAEYTGIEFVETHRTVEKIFGKPLVSINAIIDFAIEKDESLLLVNSDIVLTGLPELKEDGLTMITRQDYETHYEESRPFVSGFDVFYIPKQYLKILPPSVYALGMAFFDFWIPCRFMEKRLPIYYPTKKYAFHKLHDTQYSFQEWLRIGEYFKFEFNRNGRLNIGQITTNTMQSIKSHLIFI